MIYNRKLIQTKVLYGVVAFFVLPFIGSVAQIFESRLFFAFSMLSLAIVVVYIFLETTTGIRDYLTHLYSRRTLEDYMASLIDNNRHFEVLMIDLNHFKLVNDKYGHLAGDQVLIGFGKILQEIFKGEPMVSRLGGDEFFVVIETLNHAAIEKKLDSLIIKMQEHPILNKYGMNKFSAGISDFDGKKTMDDLYSEADKRMYQQKKMLN
jgi:diguanylate cyclase (GGDEF)-like protein